MDFPAIIAASLNAYFFYKTIISRRNELSNDILNLELRIKEARKVLDERNKVEVIDYFECECDMDDYKDNQK